ncbi:uncharacterized protein LOC127529825 [Erpetoichthys calabaricus]|uniref:uncharacterized protein LOC127529825 n=1 Tax=Erpetoichthys calabaricus TaxID=27687 RepID=UPI002234575B|nr:uncharacterized protein LOC127529825 [Erpetoichthys calabaricus]
MKSVLPLFVLLHTCAQSFSIHIVSSPLFVTVQSDIWLPCNFTGLSDDVDFQKLKVTWTRQSVPVAQYKWGKVSGGLRFSLQEDRLKAGDASLHLSPVSMKDEGQYWCRVEYKAEKMDSEVYLRIRAPPQVHVTLRSNSHGSDGVINCSATGFYPANIKFTLRQGSEMLKSESPSARSEPDGTFSASSAHFFNWSTRVGDPFFCEVNHDALEEPIRTDSRRESPGVLLTMAVPNLDSVVVCLCDETQESVKKFIWRKDETILLIDTPHTLRSLDGHKSVMSRYRFTPNGQEKLSCEVHYVSGLSERKFVQYTGHSRVKIAGAGVVILIPLLLLLLIIVRQTSVSLTPLIPVHLRKSETHSITCTLTGWCLRLISLRWSVNGKRIEMEPLDGEKGDFDEKLWLSTDKTTNFSMKKGPTKMSCCQGETTITFKFTPEKLESENSLIRCRALHRLTRRRVIAQYLYESKM